MIGCTNSIKGPCKIPNGAIIRVSLILLLGLMPANVSATQHPPEERAAATTQPIEDQASVTILIGPEHVVPGDARYAIRTEVGGQAALVEFSLFPQPETPRKRAQPPSLQDLINNPLKQAELDRSAKPGDWVTPPAARR